MKMKLILFAATAIALASCGGKTQKQATATTSAGSSSVKVEATTPVDLAALPEEPMVAFETTLGTMKVKLYSYTPLHRDSFLELVNSGFYNGIPFHRVINGFMIQTGNPGLNVVESKRVNDDGPGYTIPAEIKFPLYYHKRGALAAARTGDEVNPEKMSSGSQFYIVQGKISNDEELDAIEVRNGIKYTTAVRNDYKTVGGAAFLDGGYTVFGELVDGFGVLDAIAATPTDAQDKPTTDVVILKASIVKE